MSNKKPLPTWKDKNLPSARTWKSPSIIEFKNTEESARASLEKGETVSTPYGELKFSKHIYEDWKNKSAKEIWQLPNGGVPTYFIEDINGLNLFRK